MDHSIVDDFVKRITPKAPFKTGLFLMEISTKSFANRREKGVNVMDINEIKAGSVMNALVAEAFGWQAFKEKRGEYELCVSIAPGEKMPWERRQKPNPERYSKTREVNTFSDSLLSH